MNEFKLYLHRCAVLDQKVAGELPDGLPQPPVSASADDPNCYVPGDRDALRAKARKYIEVFLKQGHRGKKPALGVDAVVMGPPPLTDLKGWSKDGLVKWADVVFAAIEEVMQGDLPLLIYEKACVLGPGPPVAHVRFVPCVKGVRGKLRISWTSAQAMAAARAEGAEISDPRGQLTVLSERLQKLAGEPFGLARSPASPRRDALFQMREIRRLKKKIEEQHQVYSLWIWSYQQMLVWLRDAARDGRLLDGKEKKETIKRFGPFVDDLCVRIFERAAILAEKSDWSNPSNPTIDEIRAGKGWDTPPKKGGSKADSPSA